MASWIGARPTPRLWDHLLTRIPGIGILYGSTKSLGEAFFSKEPRVFQKVVLVPWPRPGMWRIGFITGRASKEIRKSLERRRRGGVRPAHPEPRLGLRPLRAQGGSSSHLDWPVEDGLRVVISGGVVQPGTAPTDVLGFGPILRAETPMALVRCEGIVLKTHALGDTSLIVVAYTREHGPDQAGGQGGAHEPEPLRLSRSSRCPRSRFVLYLKPDRDLHLLSQAEVLEPTGSRLADLARLAHAQAALELIDRLVWGEGRTPSCSTCSPRRCAPSTTAPTATAAPR